MRGGLGVIIIKSSVLGRYNVQRMDGQGRTCDSYLIAAQFVRWRSNSAVWVDPGKSSSQSGSLLIHYNSGPVYIDINICAVFAGEEEDISYGYMYMLCVRFGCGC